MPRTSAALALAAALAAAGARAEDGVRATATLHVRTTASENVPGTAVLFDPFTRTFDLDGYLVPEVDDRYGSAFASLALDGSLLEGDLRWRLHFDTGELRRKTFHRSTPVCFTGTGTGFVIAPPFGCPSPPLLFLQDTRVGPLEWTSNGRRAKDEIETTFLVREAYAAYSFGRAGFATLRAGRMRFAVGDGFVHDDYATGVALGLDLGAIGPRWDVSLGLYEPSRDFPRGGTRISPLAAVRLDFVPTLFEHAGLFLAAHRDRTGSVGELFRGALVERLVGALARASPGNDAEYVPPAHALALAVSGPLESEASLAWLGTSGSLAPWRGQRVSWTAALLRGRIDRIFPAGAPDVDLARGVSLRGRLASLRWDGSVGKRLGLGAFLLYMSGGEFPAPLPRSPLPVPATGEYGGFVGITPFVTATNLFFGGGLSETFAARQATAPGVNGRGVLAPGALLAFDPRDDLGIEAKGAWLFADAEGPYGGRVYGPEADLGVTWSPFGWLVIGAELDVLWPGDFYGGGATVYKTVLAVDLLTP